MADGGREPGHSNSHRCPCHKMKQHAVTVEGEQPWHVQVICSYHTEHHTVALTAGAQRTGMKRMRHAGARTLRIPTTQSAPTMQGITSKPSRCLVLDMTRAAPTARPNLPSQQDSSRRKTRATTR